ncbi:PREDICTED: calexcitin-2-like [Papilio polytes]|uniref:calexcitin-2-like n=1 Tax=Papilio polytes TaxID=76194 RepID=UPI000676467B|nr:PREDICTED: calexcitin-2-like [Papilio polytes]
MVSEYRKKKYLDIFGYYDTDNNGKIEKKDFETTAAMLAKSPDGKIDEAKHKEYLNTLLAIWSGLQQADTNKDGHVSAEEWVAQWDAYAKNPASPYEWQKIYCKFSFDILDAGNDGSIDSDEFVKAYEAWGFKKEDAAKTFGKLSQGKSSLSWTEYQKLWQEYFTTEDTNAVGNLLFSSPSP